MTTDRTDRSERKDREYRPDTADTLPATSDTLPAHSDPGPGAPERSNRSTMPDIAPPFAQRYRLGAELGRGGRGRVVEAFYTHLVRTVALKEVLPRAGVDERFEREVQITARLEHPSIVPLYDAGTMPDGRPFYVMRRVTGRPLDELIGKHHEIEGRLGLLPNVLAAIDAIAHAHKRGIIHRDLKPGNILVGENGETIVIDWGLAKVIGEADASAGSRIEMAAAGQAGGDGLQTVAGAVFGTPGFMAPEQARGDELGPGGDVFALGATLYQLLVGRPPIAGKSATDMIASSIIRRIQPVAEAAPTAPAELVAIVEKALAYEASDRYPHAGGLAEDVRRFLTGQLVAAHRYTRRERLARFARRHRAPLSVAALALAAGAVMAWIGVHRIVTERDAANQARGEAETQREQTLRANVQLVERADQLLVTRARAMVETNPNEAIALLKDLRANSARLGEARAIATSAISRGVAWAMRSEGEPRHVAVDADVSHLAVTTGDDTLRIWDLVTHRVLYDRAARDAMPIWVANHRLLLLRATGCELLDPNTAAIEALPELPPSWLGIATTAGDRVAILGKAGESGIFELATKKWTPLWPGHTATTILYAPDGSWIALADTQKLVILDPTGKVIFERAGEAVLERSTARRVAALDRSSKPPRALEIDLSATPKLYEYPILLAPNDFLMLAKYRGDTLSVSTVAFTNHYVDHKLIWTTPVSTIQANTADDIGDSIDVRAAADGSLRFSGDLPEGRIATPVPVAKARIAGRHGQNRFVAVATGLVLIYDLAEIVPRTIPKRGEFVADWLDDETILLWPDDSLRTYRFHDLGTGVETPIEFDSRSMARAVSGDPASGRLLVVESVSQSQERLVEIDKGATTVRTFGTAASIKARMVAKGLVVARDNDPRVLYASNAGPFVELVKVAGGVLSLMPLANNRFAALGKSWEFVRGAIAGGSVERVRAEVDASSFVATDQEGHPIVATGKRLFVWDTTLHQLAELPRPAVAIQAAPSGLIVTLDNNAAVYLETSGQVVTHDVVLESSSMPAVGGDGTWIAAPGNGGKITIVEIPSLVRWELPDYESAHPLIIAAPRERRLMRGVGSRLAIYDFPAPSLDFATWLDEHTNAYENPDGFVSWPWLKPRGP
ncbi:hypothetical protein BH11MYX1_BH11MYX1_29840 [soil metagenome]